MGLIPFSSPEGRVLFGEALQAGTLEAFFPLIEQFHTQTDPAFCGLASLVMTLNALGVDPGRVWRGPWRWFSEELLECCTPLSRVQEIGVSLDEVACLARCNGATATLSYPGSAGARELRAAVQSAAGSSDRALIVSYSRGVLGQTGAGHFSPIGGYHEPLDRALVLDVARFKYPPHWVGIEDLFQAMRDPDPATGRSRGWLMLERGAAASAIARYLVCPEGLAVREVLARLLRIQADWCSTDPPRTLQALCRLSAAALEESGILKSVRFRAPETREQLERFEPLRDLFSALPLYRLAAQALEAAQVAPVVIWLLAAQKEWCQKLLPDLTQELKPLVDVAVLPDALASEVGLLRSQLEFLLDTSLTAGGRVEDDE